ncbi:MAG: tRNA (adenosine(37)-N6)-dimethylallyltransferase MiaA [Verrucomicrobiaceae bacterium]|nr:MAG: tRNA (adenosine(37)-N6)-dimethylallyltransferase MiaA [Verrucomicrobiaceae bacterium]
MVGLPFCFSPLHMNTRNSVSSPAPCTFYLAGPTAVGKTDVALAVAEKLGAEIVGCDAFQVYEGLPVLTAIPPPEALSQVPHHLIGEIPLSQSFDVAQYRTLALERITEIHNRGKPALVTGGTGMYLRALTRGLADLPPADPTLRVELDSKGLEKLQERLWELDPVGFSQVDLKNRRRVIRALEVCILTGKPFSQFRQEWDTPLSDLKGVLLTRERTELNARINRRVLEMFESGVVNEVANAGSVGTSAAQALGLREVQAVLEGELSLEEAISRIQQATRHYAKRQITWFRKEPWLEPINLGVVPSLAETVRETIRILKGKTAS